MNPLQKGEKDITVDLQDRSQSKGVQAAGKRLTTLEGARDGRHADPGKSAAAERQRPQ